MERQLATFSVRNAECAVEADRAIVEGKIKEWFGSLATFDQCVHGGVVRDGGPSRGLLGVLQAALGSEHSIDQMTVFFENSSALPWIMYDCMALVSSPTYPYRASAPLVAAPPLPALYPALPSPAAVTAFPFPATPSMRWAFFH